MARPYIRRQILDPPPPSWVDTLMARVFEIAATAGVYRPEIMANARRNEQLMGLGSVTRKRHSRTCPSDCRCHYDRVYQTRQNRRRVGQLQPQ